jgi:glycosyltransferase involved in cell wall biosynthesis
MRPLVSVVIPAHNEGAYIGKCLECVKRAAKRIEPQETEIIVVANRCTDDTAEVAKTYGAKVVENGAKCIAAVRNAGCAAARGKFLVTIDADSYMGENALAEVCELLHSGKYIGGGAVPTFDRASLGIFCSTLVVAVNLLPVMAKEGGFLSGAMFWTYTKAFRAVGGFDESLVSLEDMDFAKRLKAFGCTYGRKYGTLRTKLMTSARKFDQFGDWYLLKDYKTTKAIFTGKDREAADRFYYDVR